MAKSGNHLRRRSVDQRASRGAGLAALAAIATLGGCDAGTTKIIGADYPAPSCDVVAAPPAGVDAFYQRYRDANGIPVLSSAAVPDAAVHSACIVVVRMLSAR